MTKPQGYVHTKFSQGNTRASKLTASQVLTLRERYIEGWSQGRLSREYGISIGQVGRIVRGEAWQHYYQPPQVGEIEHSEAMVKLDAADPVDLDPALARALAEELAAASAVAKTPVLPSSSEVLAKAAFYTSGAKPPVEDNQETHHATDTQRDPAPAGRADPSDPHGGAAEPPDRHQHSGPVGTGSPSEAEDQPLGAQSDEPG